MCNFVLEQRAEMLFQLKTTLHQNATILVSEQNKTESHTRDTIKFVRLVTMRSGFYSRLSALCRMELNACARANVVRDFYADHEKIIYTYIARALCCR